MPIDPHKEAEKIESLAQDRLRHPDSKEANQRLINELLELAKDPANLEAVAKDLNENHGPFSSVFGSPLTGFPTCEVREVAGHAFFSFSPSAWDSQSAPIMKNGFTVAVKTQDDVFDILEKARKR